MKKLLLLVLVIIFFTNCKKDDNNNDNNDNNNVTPPVTTVTDIDGNIYNTVTIGTQVWMVENLKVTHYRNGDPIKHVTDDTEWSNLTTGAYCNYDNIGANVFTYGRLYNWYAIADGPIITPLGWHIPSEAEWTTLTTYLGGESIAGGKLKEAGITHWISPNTGATNETGFTGLPGGCRVGSFYYMGSYGYWWSSVEHGGGFASYWSMAFSYTDCVQNVVEKNKGYSVRCIKDN